MLLFSASHFGGKLSPFPLSAGLPQSPVFYAQMQYCLSKQTVCSPAIPSPTPTYTATCLVDWGHTPISADVIYCVVNGQVGIQVVVLET